MKENTTQNKKLHTYSEHIISKCFGPEAGPIYFKIIFSEDLLLEIKNIDYMEWVML